MKLKYRKKSTKTGKNVRGGGEEFIWLARIYTPVVGFDNEVHGTRILACKLLAMKYIQNCSRLLLKIIGFIIFRDNMSIFKIKYARAQK